MSSEKVIASGAAGRYAVALFTLAEDHSCEAEIERDLTRLRELVEESSEFRVLIESPILDRDQQWMGICTVAKELELHRLVKNFLGVLTRNRRLDQLGSIIEVFEKLAAAKRGEISASVVSATELTNGQISELAATLKSVAGREVQIETMVDESILGGLIVRIGSRMVDSSLHSKLENLRMSLKGI